MKSETFVRLLAGSMTLLSAALVYFVSPWWLLLTCFVGINLIQSVFTGFCLPEIVARKAGLVRAGSETPACCAGKAAGEA